MSQLSSSQAIDCSQPTVSPTDSQMKYSFEHEPIYDVPPMMDTVVHMDEEGTVSIIDYDVSK